MSLDVQTSPTVDSNRLGESVADLLERLGDVPARRVRLHPWPGTATEQDVAGIEEREKRLFELVEGVLVEKDMGFVESYLASELLRLLGNYVVEHNLGIVLGPDGMMRLARGLVRIPDVSFFCKRLSITHNSRWSTRGLRGKVAPRGMAVRRDRSSPRSAPWTPGWTASWAASSPTGG